MDVKSITKQIGDRQAQFKKNRSGGPRQPMKNRYFDNSLVLAGGKNGAWTPHDLRRTGATRMQALGIPLETIDRCQIQYFKEVWCGANIFTTTMQMKNEMHGHCWERNSKNPNPPPGVRLAIVNFEF
jgi:integrase